MLQDSAFLIPTYIRNLQMLMMFVSFNQQNQPLVSYFYLQLQQSDPRPRACSLSVLTLLFFWYVSDKFKFIQLETQHAGKFMTTTTCAHDLNFILIFHFLHFFLSSSIITHVQTLSRQYQVYIMCTTNIFKTEISEIIQ